MSEYIKVVWQHPTNRRERRELRKFMRAQINIQVLAMYPTKPVWWRWIVVRENERRTRAIVRKNAACRHVAAVHIEHMPNQDVHWCPDCKTNIVTPIVRVDLVKRGQ